MFPSASSSAASSGTSQTTAPPPASKRRKYNPVPLVPDDASVAQLNVLHQQTSLQFVLDDPPVASHPQWHARGRATLYVIRETHPPASEASSHPVSRSTAATIALALLLRSTCAVTKVQVAALDDGAAELAPLRTSYHHADPLRHVLLRPAGSYTVPDPDRPYRFHADAQSFRGAVGMTAALRVASIASNMGELRITAERPPSQPVDAAPGRDGEDAKEKDWLSRVSQLWRRDLVGQLATTAGQRVRSLQETLWERSAERRDSRLELVSRRLAQAGSSALRVTVEYSIPLPTGIRAHHLAGLHVLADATNPHVYTTTGVYGDHEGPRCWVPCCDSAGVEHRATHELTIQLTAPMSMGLSIAGAGEDFGCSIAMLLHRKDWDRQQAEHALGSEYVDMLHTVWSKRQQQTQVDAGMRDAQQTLHVIPSDVSVESLTQIQATVAWTSSSWSPIPARSLGFAIGPFKVVEDPEYFGLEAFAESVASAADEDDPMETLPVEDKHRAFVEAARRDGKGIRQLYFAPLYERKFIHEQADRSLLPKTTILLTPLTPDEVALTEKFDNTVTFPTTGVPHRALSLMRDILAVPVFRTGSYNQIWIPEAVHGGVTSGALHSCPEVLVNPFLGGAIMDARLLPPIDMRLPFHGGGRVLQFVQARSAVRGWIFASLPLGGHDDVGKGYIFTTVESFIMSLYERGHGAYGEGGARGGTLYSKRYAGGCGLNSPNLDFLPVQNIEDFDPAVGGVGAVPVEERHNDQLWRSYTNGTESHTAALDEFSVRQLLVKDAVEALERGTDKDSGVPLPSMGWFGSHLSLTFFSSNATTSSDLGCGAVEMQHPVGGLVYRTLKSDVFRSIVEGRSGISNFVRLLRVAFIAAHLDDIGERELRLPTRREKKGESDGSSSFHPDRMQGQQSPPFVVCVNEVLKKKGLSHNLFTRALQNLSGPLREHLLLGSLVDVERHAEDPRTQRPFIDPEGFPNSYVRGSSQLYCRVGVYVETAKEAGTQAQAAALVSKGVQMQAYAEPVIPEGGIAFGGPITMRVVENEGQFREYNKDLDANGSRRDWGAVFLHAKPVTTVKAQTAASGAIEGAPKDSGKSTVTIHLPSLEVSTPTRGFNDDNFHTGGYQAIELIRFTNLTPLLWVRVDPNGVYGGRISVFQSDACLAECLYHDGDAAAQIDALRALAERPLRIQPATKLTTIYDVDVAELPVRVIGDCLRGSATAHSSLPHTPAVRSQAALAIAQWQNNKGPKSKDDVGADKWVGLNLLFQYLRERFVSNGVIMPLKFSRVAVKKSQSDAQSTTNANEGGASTAKSDDGYSYLDSIVLEDKASILEDAECTELEEDEEYKVFGCVVTAVASIRAGDGQTPPTVVRFLEKLLKSENGEAVGHLIYPDEELIAEQNKSRRRSDETEGDDDSSLPALLYASNSLMADYLLALCHVNVSPRIIMDPATGKPIQATDPHPVTNLVKAARNWLDWELYRDKIRVGNAVQMATGFGYNNQSLITSSAVIALVSLVLLMQSTSDPSDQIIADLMMKEIASVKYYKDIYDSSRHSDLTRAACAQAIACLYCAADRFATNPSSAVGLLTALEYLLEKIVDIETSPSLRETLALLMLDATTGKVCSTQRVGVIGGRNDLATSASRLMTGPLGASQGGDNGSSLLTTVSAALFPAANAVNDGARRGLRLLTRAGHPRETVEQALIVRIAIFATRLWRTINGEPVEQLETRPERPPVGACAYNGALRCSLLALWQWIWPKGCYAVLSVQAWGHQCSKELQLELGVHHVMQTTEDEKSEGGKEELENEEINQIVAMELDRQSWRGEMAKKAYDMYTATKASMQHHMKAEQGIGQPLPPIERDASFKQGGWISSAAQQRRRLALDGGTAVTKLRLNVKNVNDN